MSAVSVDKTDAVSGANPGALHLASKGYEVQLFDSLHALRERAPKIDAQFLVSSKILHLLLNRS